MSAELRQSYFDHLKHAGVFELAQRMRLRRGDVAGAFHAAEASRNRELLGLQALNGADPLAIAAAQARQRGDVDTQVKVELLQRKLEDNRAGIDRALRDRVGLGDEDLDTTTRRDRAEALEATAKDLRDQQRRLLDEAARLTAGTATQTDVSTLVETQAVLAEGELLLEFTISADSSVVYVIGNGSVETFPLDTAKALVADLPVTLAAMSRGPRPDTAARGRDPDGSVPADRGAAASQSLFRALVPQSLWRQLLGCKRVWIAGHGALHRLPFEALVVSRDGDRLTYWLDVGPPIAYVPSASVLHWLRKRRKHQGLPEREMLAVGDPTPTVGSAVAETSSTGVSERLTATQRAGDIERIAHLPPLKGARREVEAVVASFREAGEDRVLALLGASATEAAVFQHAASTRIVHFACHGIAEEFAGQSLSMLVLSPPPVVCAEDDGLLKLEDLITRWGGRLAACELVVLSACRTQVGQTFRDDAPKALPMGFLLAGARAVIASLWAVDDESTRELMVDFHHGMRGDGGDRLLHLVEAKRRLRASHPDPFYWAPFLYLGNPD